jgi:hypothetical protein
VARPIKETPVLIGNDARRFDEAVKNNENRKVPRESYERAINFFKSVTDSSAKSLGTKASRS